MRHSPLTHRLLLAFGGLLVGWGLARLLPFLASQWPLVQWARTALQQAIPIWLWGLLLLAAGVAILLWSMGKRGPKIVSTEDASIDNSAGNGSYSPAAAAPSSGQLVSSTVAPTGFLESADTHDRSEIETPLTIPNGINGRQHSGNGADLQTPDKANSSHIPSPKPKQPSLDSPKPDGPKIVAIGGGTGMPQLLRGLRDYTDNITAIVTVADDGGSSGRLRYMGVLPPGDFRNNIAALSESEDLITRLFQYRFAQSQFSQTVKGSNEQDDKTGLAGHNFGNLFIATMAAVTGSFESGLAESSRVLAVRGRVLPSTLEHVTLCAEICRPVQASSNASSLKKSGSTQPALDAQDARRQDKNVEDEDVQTEWVLVEGESEIPEAGGTIQRVFLKPQSPHAYPEAIRAILQADLILAGPGSFFTSILPNLLVPAVRDAIRASGAPSLYLCNVASQPGETDGYTVSTHMHQLRLHVGDAFTNVLANDAYDAETAISANCHWIPLPNEDRQPGMITDTLNGQSIAYRLFTGDLVDEESPAKHDANKLAARVMDVYAQLKEEADERN